MSRLLGTAVLAAVLLAGYAPVSAQQEKVLFDIEPGWKVGYQAETPQGYYIIEFVRDNDDIENWKELVTVQKFFILAADSSPQQAFEKLQEIRERECPGSTTWNVIAQDTKSILYEWQAKLCRG